MLFGLSYAALFVLFGMLMDAYLQRLRPGQLWSGDGGRGMEMITMIRVWRSDEMTWAWVNEDLKAGDVFVDESTDTQCKLFLHSDGALRYREVRMRKELDQPK